jgi:glycosyltransferase involved in cell wall biosynthesis
MRIAIIMEQSRAGGPDSMISDLINNWPQNDEFIVYVNSSHESRMKSRGDFSGDHITIEHLPGVSRGTLHRKFEPLIPSVIVWLVAELLFIPMLVYSILRQYFLLRKAQIDRVLVNNGGYPGGDLCIAGTFASKLAGLSPILIIHNLPAQPRYRRLATTIDSLIDKSATIVCVSNQAASKLASRRNISQDIRVIHNGVSRERIEQEDSFDQTMENPTVLTIANLEARKGHKYLFSALSEVSHPVDLVIIGDGLPQEITKIEDLITEYTNGNVLFLQNVDNVGKYYQMADLYVLPSIKQESLPMTIIEAFSFGLPVVATDVGGIQELIEPGKNGILIEPSNEVQLRNAIERVLGSGLERTLSENARQFYTDRHTVEEMVAEYYELLVEC